VICAYDKVYLDKARISLGRMLDFAVHDLGYDLEEFFNLFIKTGLADRFGTGDFSLIVGMSGVELAYKVLEESNITVDRGEVKYSLDRSEEYWTGWALAYYQWYTALTFKDIIGFIAINDIKDLYHPYHEMDIRQFVDKLNEFYKEHKQDTNLKLLRSKLGMSQRELAELSGVPLRTIQQYEQRQKNINNAKAEYIIKLAKVLICNVEDLIEKVA
jgi:DNA-binding transcriptional regulator YiaG